MIIWFQTIPFQTLQENKKKKTVRETKGNLVLLCIWGDIMNGLLQPILSQQAKDQWQLLHSEFIWLEASNVIGSFPAFPSLSNSVSWATGLLCPDTPSAWLCPSISCSPFASRFGFRQVESVLQILGFLKGWGRDFVSY